MGVEQPAALKEIFDEARLRRFADETAAIWPAFDGARFLAVAMENLADLGIMQRMRRTAAAFDATLPDDYGAALDILAALAPRIRHGFASIALCEFVVLRGADDFERSMEALRRFTRYGTAEFAVRPFLRRDPARTLAVMRGWASDDDEHVRRLASEGSRPRLPWSFQLESVAADPDLAWPILDALKADPSPYVRKSVANHLNDVSKAHPEWLIGRLAAWPADRPETAWIVRHAARTLVKKGDVRALALLGAGDEARLVVERFTVSPGTLRLGERIALAARLASDVDHRQRLVVDYAIHYVKKNGAISRKVFKWKELTLAPGAVAELAISQTIRDFTTRTHNAGRHEVELLVNGRIFGRTAFDLAL